MIDKSLYDSFPSSLRREIKPDCIEYDDFWEAMYTPADKRIEYYRRFIDDCELKLSNESEPTRQSGILAATANARKCLGSELSISNQTAAEAESELDWCELSMKLTKRDTLR